MGQQLIYGIGPDGKTVVPVSVDVDGKVAVTSATGSGTVIPLVNASGGASFTTASTGQWVDAPGAVCTFEAILSNTTTPAATVEIHGSNTTTTTPGVGTRLGTITLSGANDTASFAAFAAAYRYKCAKVTSITGASAAATVSMGV